MGLFTPIWMARNKYLKIINIQVLQRDNDFIGL